MIKVEPVIPENNQNGYQGDLDLIDVLWRQDIDLGIGREAFDINLRHELETERELELQKNREKNKELELLRLKHEEQCRQQEQQWLSENFMQDGETGEWVPLGGQNVPQHSLPQFQTPPQPQPQEIYRPREPLQANFMQYGNMNIVNPDLPRECESSFQMHHPLEVMSPPHQAPVTPQQHPQHSSYTTDSNSYRNPVPQTLPTSPIVPEVPYRSIGQELPPYSPPVQEFRRQESLEQRWMDLVNLLDLNAETESHMSMLMDANVPEISSPTLNTVTQHSPDNTSEVLLQNATMPAMPSAINNTMPTFDNAAILQQPRNYNSSVPSDGSASPLDWEPSRMLFPNVTDALNSEDNLEEVDELLPDIISDDMLDEITSADMPLAEGLQSLHMRTLDDGSSDSAMGSDIGSESPAQDYDSMSSPSDGLGGAMGGSPGYSGSSKYNPDDYNPNGNAYSLSPGGSSGQSNYSSSSNDTGFGYSEPNNHVQHNHTYPCQPGAQPKEVKKYIKTDKPRHKGPHPRDRKRAEELSIPFTVDQIVESQVEEFNELLSGHKLTDPQLQLVRDIRRRGKNKVAAQNCRKRKLDVIFTLEDEMTHLLTTKDRLLKERHMIDKQTREMKDKFGQLYKEIFQSLRDEHGHPYDPQQFSLQQSSDGNVFLVPRNVSMEDQDSNINKKRKNDEKK